MPQGLKFVVVPMGSAGDVHPLTWLGRVLAARGHEVVLLVQNIVDPIARRSGLRHISYGDLDQQQAMIAHSDLWHPRRAFHLIARSMPALAREMAPLVEREIAARGADGTIVIAGSLAFGARIAAEQADVPAFSIHLQPSLMMSIIDTPVMMAGMEWMATAPVWVKRAFFGIGRWQVGRILGKPVVKVRRERGLPRCTESPFLRDPWNSPDGVLCLFPDWFAPKVADWPAHAVTTRFPLYDEGQALAHDSAVEQFLAAGDAPVIITPGSANAQAGRFLQEAVRAVELAGRRGIVATRFLEQVPALPADVKAFEYIPFGRIFPRAAAVIHHGGIGTTAQCLAAGVPQLLMPMAHDQPDNAARIKRFGVGDYLYPKSFVADRIAAKLKHLSTSPDTRDACATYRQKVDRQMTESDMGELIEDLSERALRVRAINGCGVG